MWMSQVEIKVSMGQVGGKQMVGMGFTLIKWKRNRHQGNRTSRLDARLNVGMENNKMQS